MADGATPDVQGVERPRGYRLVQSGRFVPSGDHRPNPFTKVNPLNNFEPWFSWDYMGAAQYEANTMAYSMARMLVRLSELVVVPLQIEQGEQIFNAWYLGRGVDVDMARAMFQARLLPSFEAREDAWPLKCCPRFQVAYGTCGWLARKKSKPTEEELGRLPNVWLVEQDTDWAHNSWESLARVARENSWFGWEPHVLARDEAAIQKWLELLRELELCLPSEDSGARDDAVGSVR